MPLLQELYTSGICSACVSVWFTSWTLTSGQMLRVSTRTNHTFRNSSAPSKPERGPERSCRINTQRELISARKTSHTRTRVAFLWWSLRTLNLLVCQVNLLVYRGRRGPLLLWLCDVFRALITPLSVDSSAPVQKHVTNYVITGQKLDHSFGHSYTVNSKRFV